jgi:hypothetical protein
VLRRIVLLLLALAGCYSPSRRDCVFLCATGDPPCPDGYRCSEGFCVGNDFEGTCRPPDDTPPSACSTERMIVLLDPAQAVPAGWRCVSCGALDKLFDRFPVGAAAFGAQGGTTMHAHQYSLPEVVTPSNFSFLDGAAGAGQPNGDGMHAASGTVASTTVADHVPPFINFALIEPLAPITELPMGAIILIATQTAPNADFEIVGGLDGAFIHASGVPGAGGAATHTHAINTALATSAAGGALIPAGNVGAALAHDHAINAAIPDSSNDPQHVVIVLARVAAPATPLPIDAIAMFDIPPAAPWEILSDAVKPLAGQFLKIGTVPDFGPHGSNTHDPMTITFTTGMPSANAGFAGGGLQADADDHTHDVPITFSVEDQRPPYAEVILARLGQPGCP